MLIPSCRSEKILTESVSDIKTERRLENEQVVCYIHDSVVIVRNDTAVVRETKWRDRVVEHVVTKVDTVQVAVEKLVTEEKVVERKILPKWVWWIIGYGLLITGYGMIRIALVVRRRLH